MKQFPWFPDVAVLIARVLVGVVFLAHGAQKFFAFGISGTTEAFTGMGVPAPQVAATLAALVELVGGAALILGIATPAVGILLALDMLGAYVLVHAGNGVFVDAGGFELVAALGSAALLLAAVGAHRYSLDHVLAGRRRSSAPSTRATTPR